MVYMYFDLQICMNCFAGVWLSQDGFLVRKEALEQSFLFKGVLWKFEVSWLCEMRKTLDSSQDLRAKWSRFGVLRFRSDF
jgi:hypothetical protein